MSHRDNFQDWNTVVLRNKEIKNRNTITEVQKRHVGKQIPKEENLETPQQMITHDQKQKIISTRLALKLNQEKLATSINVKPQEIKTLEIGKLTTLKEAKQIAIKIERKFRVKILENN